ncbi:MAG: ribosome silencing factor [Mariprofundaceae bacterium]
MSRKKAEKNEMAFEQLTQAVVAAVEDKKAQDVLIIDVRGRCAFADRFVLATGRSDRQLKAMAQAVSETAHQHGLAVNIEGLDAMEWLLIDLGDVVVHLFLPEVRESFQLERLWEQPSTLPGGKGAQVKQ